MHLLFYVIIKYMGFLVFHIIKIITQGILNILIIKKDKWYEVKDINYLNKDITFDI